MGRYLMATAQESVRDWASPRLSPARMGLLIGGGVLLVRVLWLLRYPLDLGDDGWGFVQDAGAWLEGPTPTRPPKYPLHMLLLIALRAALPMVDPNLMGRVLSALAGSLAVGLLAGIGTRCGGALRGATAGLFLAGMPWFIWNNASTSVEPLFIALVVGHFGATLARRSHLASILAALSAVVRLEGFALVALDAARAVARASGGRSSWRPVVTALGTGACAAAIFPLVSLACTGEPWAFLLLNRGAGQSLAVAPEALAIRLFYPAAFYYLATPAVALFAAWGTLAAWCRGRVEGREVTLMGGMLLGFQVFLMVTQVTVTEMRYLLYAGALLMLPAGAAAVEWGERLVQIAPPHRRGLFGTLAILVLGLGPMAVQWRTGDEICRRADTQRRTVLAAAARLCPDAGSTVTLAALRQHMNLIRTECARRGAVILTVPLDFSPPEGIEAFLQRENVTHLLFARGDVRLERQFPALGQGGAVQGQRCRYEPVATVPVRIAPSAHLAPGTYKTDASLILYRVSTPAAADPSGSQP